MARSVTKARLIASFKHPVKVEVYQPEFEFFDSAHLDIAKLERSSHAEIELGYLKNSCCPQIIRAIIQKGKVTALRVQPCSEKNEKPSSPELKGLLNEVSRKFKRQRKHSPRFPIPVRVFMRSSASMVDIATETLTCYSICIYGACLICCKIESTGVWMCSTTGFTIKPPKQK